MDTNTIEINNKGIKVDVSVFLFKEDDVFHAYCPELDLVGYDYTEDGARKSFEWVLKDYSTIRWRTEPLSRTY